MANFDFTKQKKVGLSGLAMETGSAVTIASVSAQTFTVATKLKKVVVGFGTMDADGMLALASTGIVSSGQVTFTRKAPIATSADAITYVLYGY